MEALKEVVKKKYPSQEELRELFTYSEKEGNLVRAGRVAGSVSWSSGGYRSIKIKGQKYVASRLVWIYHNGDIPAGMTVDHIIEQPIGVSKMTFNSKDVNNISNLQLLSKKDQQRKSYMLNKNSTNVLPGIRERKGRYSVSISVDNERISLGTYGSLQEAKQVRHDAEEMLWGKAYTVV